MNFVNYEEESYTVLAQVCFVLIIARKPRAAKAGKVLPTSVIVY